MATTTSFNDGQNGAEIRERLNAMWADWLAALETAVGKDGWSPLLHTVADGAREVIELHDWFGGTGVKPTAVGYMGASGLVSNIALAKNFRGSTGNNGTNGWSPLFRVVESADDDPKALIMLYDWAGGTGVKPTTTGYMGFAGIVQDDAAAIDFRGPVGLIGPANELSIGTVTIGSEGVDAAASITGVYPEQKLNLLLPKGTTGATSTVTVGTVMSGEPGTEVLITPRGTATDLILDFVIPRGDPGEGDGDVLGPSDATDGAIVQFEGATGKALKSLALSGLLKHTLGVPAVAVPGTDYISRIAIPLEGVDFDSLNVDGLYSLNPVAASVSTNLPMPKQAGVLFVQTISEIYWVQTYVQIFSGKIFQRRRYITSWLPWYSIYSSIDPQANVTGNAGTATKLAMPFKINEIDVDGSSDVTIPTGAVIASLSYEARGDMRSTVGDFSAVESLGVFKFVTGSTEPDDDESCFATATGRWLLCAADWDLMETWQMIERQTQEESIEDTVAAVDLVDSKILYGSATCAITAVAASASIAFVGVVRGAAIGDRVVVNAPGLLDATSTQGRLSFYAWISAADTVTVTIVNPSTSSVATNVAVRTAWPVTVIKN